MGKRNAEAHSVSGLFIFKLTVTGWDDLLFVKCFTEGLSPRPSLGRPNKTIMHNLWLKEWSWLLNLYEGVQCSPSTLMLRLLYS